MKSAGKHGKGPGGKEAPFSMWRYAPFVAVLMVGGWLVYLFKHASNLHLTVVRNQPDHTPHNLNMKGSSSLGGLGGGASSSGGSDGSSVSPAVNKDAMDTMGRNQFQGGTPEQAFFQKWFGFSSKTDWESIPASSQSDSHSGGGPTHSNADSISSLGQSKETKSTENVVGAANIGGGGGAKHLVTAGSAASNSQQGRKMPRVQPVLGDIPTNGVKPLYGRKHKGGDAIFALAANYPKLYYERFVGSLRKFGYHDDIVLSVSIPEKMKPGVAEYLQKTDVVAYGFDVDCEGKDNCKLKDDFFGFPDPRPYRTFANIRYALYEYWMQYYTDQSYILILDFRDTFFQSNPFASFGELSLRTPKYELQVFEENFKVKNIGKCVFNSLWVGKCFGKPALENLRDKPVLCSGSTLGSYEGIMHYVRTMLHSMDTVKCWLKGIESDQGYQNYLFYNGKFTNPADGKEAVAFRQGEGVVNTIGALNGHRVPKDMKGPLDTHWHARDKDGWIINYDGTRSACIHQWDRWYQDLVGWIDKTVFDRS
jgi:hypothetical protein